MLHVPILLTVVRNEEMYLSGLKGTPAWMSPEVISGQSVSTSTDIYGLGLIFWEMMSAEKPFEGKTLEEVSLSLNSITTALDNMKRNNINQIITVTGHCFFVNGTLGLGYEIFVLNIFIAQLAAIFLYYFIIISI